MATKYVLLPLYSDPYYSYSATLEGFTVILDFRYNERSFAWYMDIKREDGTYLLAGTKLVPYFPLAYNHPTIPLNGYFSIEPKGKAVIDQWYTDPENLDKNFSLFYQYEA